jgi:hypothetical protein
MFVAADALVEKKVGNEVALANGAITWGTAFSIRVPNDASGAYLSYGGIIIPLDVLVDGAPFKVVAAKVPVGNSFVWTLRLDDAACQQ